MILINRNERVVKSIGNVLVGKRVESVEFDFEDVSRLLKMSDDEMRLFLKSLSMRFK